MAPFYVLRVVVSISQSVRKFSLAWRKTRKVKMIK